MATIINKHLKRKISMAILRSLKEGATLFTACANAQVDPATFWRWRKKSLILDRAVTNIIESRIQLVEDALYKNAIEGNVTAQIFYLTNRNSDRWKDKRAVVNNTIFNKVGANGSFSGEDTELQNRIRKELFGISQE
jgi:ribosomal protein L16 Arg81 hydroxylase